MAKDNETDRTNVIRLAHHRPFGSGIYRRTLPANWDGKSRYEIEVKNADTSKPGD